MMAYSKNPVATELARTALLKFPRTATLALARKLRADAPEVFSSVEHARSIIRTRRGASGQKNRTRMKPEHTRTPEESEHCRRWGSLIPPAETNAWGWRELPKKVKRWLVLADLHIPYHDQQAIATALEHSADVCDGVLLLGDLIDCYSLSPWLKDPRARKFDEECNAATRFLDVLLAEKKTIVWKMGNHEMRLERYLQSRAAELWGIAQFSFEAVCELKRRGVSTIDAMDPIKVGKLALLHGHEFGSRFSSPVNPARGNYLKAKECVLAGHEHRTSEHTEPTLRETTVTCWSVGCLSDLHPRYRPLNSWNHGFAVLDLAGKDWSIRNYRIVDGKVL